MRILKFLAAAIVAALAAGSLHAQRPDTDLQAKAREALEQAEAQQNAQAAPTNKVTPPKKMKAKAPAAPAVATPEQTAAEAERAEHLQQLEAARAKQAAAPAVEIAPAPTPAKVSGGLSPEAEAKAREAMRQAMEQLDAQQKNKAATAPAMEKKHPTPTTWDQTPASPKQAFTPAPSTPVYQPSVTSAATEATPAPGMTSKQRRLEDLLNKYKMDQITPQQYFEQKAKILAEP